MRRHDGIAWSRIQPPGPSSRCPNVGSAMKFHRWIVAAGAFAVGALLWTLVEYLLHRYILHHLPYIKEMHEAHHNEQDALVGESRTVRIGADPACPVCGRRLRSRLCGGAPRAYIGARGHTHDPAHRLSARAARGVLAPSRVGPGQRLEADGCEWAMSSEPTAQLQRGGV